MINNSASNISIQEGTLGIFTSNPSLKRKREVSMSPIRQRLSIDPPFAPLKKTIDKSLILKFPSFTKKNINFAKKDLNMDLCIEKFDPDGFILDLTFLDSIYLTKWDLFKEKK